MTLIGAELTHLEAGKAVVELEVRPEVTQQHGHVHAGILTTAVDTAGGYAAYSMMPEGSEVLSTDFTMKFLRPARGDRVVAVGTVVKSGRTLTVCDLEVFMETDGERTLVAKGIQTCICIR